MGETVSLIFITIYILFGILVVLNFYFVGSLLKKLREKYPSTWNALGSPTLFWNNSMKNQIYTLGFIFKRKYKELNDPEITKTCKTILGVQILSYILFALMIISFFLVQATPLKQ